MLEELALHYINQSEGMQRLTIYSFTFAGGVLAALLHRSESRLKRSPYFVYSALLFLGFAAARFVWLASTPAVPGGYVWAFMLVDVGVGLAVGFGTAVIAKARSRDAYGHAGLAVLAFIPIANFWLLFTRTLDPRDDSGAPRILSGGPGVVLGLVLFFAGSGLTSVFGTEMQRMVERMAEAAQDNPELQRIGLDYMLRVNDLEVVLDELARGMVTPAQVDENTVIARVEGDGTTLRYTYEVTTSANGLPLSLPGNLRQQNCNYEALRPVIEAGATLEHLYLRNDGSELGVVRVNREACGF